MDEAGMSCMIGSLRANLSSLSAEHGYFSRVAEELLLSMAKRGKPPEFGALEMIDQMRTWQQTSDTQCRCKGVVLPRLHSECLSIRTGGSRQTLNAIPPPIHIAQSEIVSNSRPFESQGWKKLGACKAYPH
ncbi:hypothetical protein GOP47_0013761 [Adiantum capillus-veneris]|uniref:Uncharacterized protein n=1 Tax=Adiantum capillus-veneris TaxID=13818 RepID=A0A9D4UPD7_ADICA|nr:hypothetical protein GOP47_0013761 [Adiantum capillus-veneris]